MSPDAPLAVLLKLVLFGCWTLTYLLIIRRAYLDKTPGMPFAANCLNAAWEGMLLVLLDFGEAAWFTVCIWFVLDCVILVQYFLYARSTNPRTLSDRLFWPRSLAILAVGVGTPIAMTMRFHDYEGLIAAYFQNALMSILFCAMLLRRDSLKGQSVYIAIAKWLGTAVVIGYGEPSDAFLLWCYFVIVAFDLAYIGLILHVGRRDGIRVFRRL